MAKFILLLTGITLMYLAISGKLLNIIPIRDPLAELFICLLGLICVVLSVIYFKYKN